MNGVTFDAGGLIAIDIVDAHVVICARRAGRVVVTNDPGDVGRIDPELRLVAI